MNRTIPTGAEVEFLNVVSLSPLISRCEIKVLYCGKNRNKTFITKEVANKMAQSLPGTPIVGEYFLEIGDFGDHGDETLIIDDNGLRFIKDTVPYGFVPPNAKIWWQNFLDVDGVEREYLVTEGYLWTGRYPECVRIIESGNGQSMELNRKTFKGEWSKIENDEQEHFIVSEAMFEGLCILGEDVEPCFEGSTISRDANLVYSFNKIDFKEKMSDFMADLKETLINFSLEGGKEMPNNENQTSENTTEEVVVVAPESTVENDFAKKKDEDEDKKTDEKDDNVDDKKEPSDDEDEEKKKKKDFVKEENEDEKKKKEEFAAKEEDEDEKKKCGYSLEEVVEYTELLEKFNSLEEKYNLIEKELNSIKPEFKLLKEAQSIAESKAKDEMISSFYMLTDEDKKDVLENKSNYSLDEIESKLSVICVRNKVNFNLDDTSKNEDNTETPVVTYNVSNDFNSTPDWLRAVDRVIKNKK